jgi:DNA-directed RNA polymerase specialized sigma24 family protein
MSVSQTVAPHIPRLRRFAWALTGTQPSGDAYVSATLEAIIAGPEEFAETGDARIALYRLFLKVWRSMPLRRHSGHTWRSSDEIGARRNLDAIPLMPRLAFLLSALEEFNRAEIAAVLGCTIPQAAELIEQAQKEIVSHIRTGVLIIEDEDLIALDLLSLVEELGHTPMGIARTEREAVEIARREKPGLILSDIKLADDTSGFDVVNRILGHSPAPAIFITAHPEQILTGTPPEPTFVMTKPFCRDTLKAIISQALFFDRKSYRKARRARSRAQGRAPFPA